MRGAIETTISWTWSHWLGTYFIFSYLFLTDTLEWRCFAPGKRRKGSFLGLPSMCPRGLHNARPPSTAPTMHRYSEHICWQLKNKYRFTEKQCDHQKKYGWKKSNGRGRLCAQHRQSCGKAGKWASAGKQSRHIKEDSHFPPVAIFSPSLPLSPAPPPQRVLLPRRLLDRFWAACAPS